MYLFHVLFNSPLARREVLMQALQKVNDPQVCEVGKLNARIG